MVRLQFVDLLLLACQHWVIPEPTEYAAMAICPAVTATIVELRANGNPTANQQRRILNVNRVDRRSL
jgi:hypothetical protein